MGLKTDENNPECFVIGVAGLPRELARRQTAGFFRKDHWIITATDQISGKAVSVYWKRNKKTIRDMVAAVHPAGWLPLGVHEPETEPHRSIPS